jgi:hypothetical protein
MCVIDCDGLHSRQLTLLVITSILTLYALGIMGAVLISDTVGGESEVLKEVTRPASADRPSGTFRGPYVTVGATSENGLMARGGCEGIVGLRLPAGRVLSCGVNVK